ncbi:MAG TPA: DUF1552 domain-containing protein [Polyangia bacterium]|nr:DUF1552 domain-containing protein [Polyangia bacterium]
MTSYKLKRRAFLQACGGSAVALAPLLRSIEARAAGATAPLRLLIVHHPLGTAPGLASWRPNASATTTNFTLPVESAPFEAAGLKPYMNMIDGLNVVFATRNPNMNSGQNTHEGGIAVMMTGVPVLGRIGQQDHAAGGASIDQLLLDNSPGLGGPAQMNKTSFGSLQLAADVRSDRDEVAPRTLSYRPPLVGQTDISRARQPMAPDTQPINVYKRIFGGDVMPPGTDLAKLLAQKKSVLDYMRADLARMQTLIPASEKDRLAAHATAITQLENTLQQMYGSTSGGGTGGMCMKPMMPGSFSEVTGKQNSNGVSTDLSGVDYYVPNMPDSHPHLDLGLTQLRLIKTAFACDYVRVATFMWSAGTNWVVFPGMFQGASIAGNLQATPHHPPSHSGDAATSGWLSQINQFYSNATATALQEFVTQPDVDGGKLIDNTIIVYLTEVARAYDHNQQNMPLIVFGGKNTGLKGGTFLKVTGGPLPQQTGGSGNRPFNDLWLALLPKFGVDAKILTNAIDSGTSYLGISGAPMYTGALPGLFS